MKYGCKVAVLGACTTMLLAGCAGRGGAVKSSTAMGRPTAGGMKSPSQVAACCRPLAEGKISLAACMANPQCIANGNKCCMNAF